MTWASFLESLDSFAGLEENSAEWQHGSYSSKTSQFYFVNWFIVSIIFKIVETFILNANTANIKHKRASERKI